ncbi:porin [Campylobacter porcelli]|uniref:porin n=1 Tax=Campylobacter porcelli TaxID=1660073 RepID=UPI000A340DC6|nr:porin [Campylobacter sp. P0078]
MKLVKLSLAAIVAAGALSSVASAASLEEAVKNVDVSGYARYRFDSTNTTTNTTGATNNYHRFTSDINFKSALDDNFFGVIGFRYDSRDASGERVNAATQVGTVNQGNNADNYGQTFNVRQFYVGYKAGNTTITAGRQVLGTFFTDDMVGTGIKLLNSDISGLTLAAIAFDNLQNDGDIGTRGLFIGENGSSEFVYDRNLYGVAAIGSYDPVSFQLWYAALDSVAQLYALDVTIGANIADIDLSLQVQYAGSSMWADNARTAAAAGALPLDDAQFAAVEAGAKAFGFDASAGYVWFDTDTNSLISFEDKGSFIDAGEDILDYTLINGENKYWFLKAGYTFADKVRVGADYVSGRVTSGNVSVDEYEAVARLDYKYSKKLNFKTWYSYIDRDSGDKGDAKHLRFEARYNF